LLSVIVSECDSFLGDTIDVGGSIPHHAAIVVTDVPSADVIAPDHQDVGFFRLGCSRKRKPEYQGGEQHEKQFNQLIHIVFLQSKKLKRS
jgi:hypothetical protein